MYNALNVSYNLVKLIIDNNQPNMKCAKEVQQILSVKQARMDILNSVWTLQPKQTKLISFKYLHHYNLL